MRNAMLMMLGVAIAWGLFSAYRSFRGPEPRDVPTAAVDEAFPAEALPPGVDPTLAAAGRNPVYAPRDMKDGVLYADPEDPDSPRLERDDQGRITISNIREEPGAARIERSSDGSITIRNDPGQGRAPGPAPKPPPPAAQPTSWLPSLVPTPAPPASPAPSPPNRPAQIGRYLDEMEAISSQQEGVTPTAAARSLTTATLGGDPQQLETMKADLRSAIEKARAVDVPSGCEGCQRHHDDTLSLLADSADLLDRVGAALTNPAGAQGLENVALEGRDLQTRAEALKRTTKILRQASGR